MPSTPAYAISLLDS